MAVVGIVRKFVVMIMAVWVTEHWSVSEEPETESWRAMMDAMESMIVSARAVVIMGSMMVNTRSVIKYASIVGIRTSMIVNTGSMIKYARTVIVGVRTSMIVNTRSVIKYARTVIVDIWTSMIVTWTVVKYSRTVTW